MTLVVASPSLFHQKLRSMLLLPSNMLFRIPSHLNFVEIAEVAFTVLFFPMTSQIFHIITKCTLDL